MFQAKGQHKNMFYVLTLKALMLLCRLKDDTVDPFLLIFLLKPELFVENQSLG